MATKNEELLLLIHRAKKKNLKENLEKIKVLLKDAENDSSILKALTKPILPGQIILSDNVLSVALNNHEVGHEILNELLQHTQVKNIINEASRFFLTPMALAIKSKNLTAVQTLFSNGASVNNNEYLALLELNDPNFTELLIKLNIINKDYQQKNGNSLLAMAFMLGKNQLAKYLLSRQAIFTVNKLFDVKTLNTEMFLEYFRIANNAVIETVILDVFRNSPKDRIDLLLKDTAASFKIVNISFEILTNALKNRNYKLVDELLNLKLVNTSKQNFLHIAVKNSETELVKYILDHKLIDINAIDVLGITALQLAVQSKNSTIAKLLLDNNANPLLPTKKGQLPSIMARHIDFSDLVPQLIASEKSFIQKNPDESKKYLDFMNRRKKIQQEGGHPLGLRFNVDMEYPLLQEKTTTRSEGGYSHESITTLRTYVQSYITQLNENPIKDRDPKLITYYQNSEEALALEQAYLSFENTDDLVSLTNRINDPNKLSFTSGAIKEHAFSIGRFGDFIMITNRGFSKGQEGAYLYKLKPGAQFDKSLLQSFRNIKATDTQEFQKSINALIDPKYVPISFPLKDQEFGTCSFVNAKSAQELALFAQKFYELPTKTQEALFEKMKIDSFEQRPLENDVNYQSRLDTEKANAKKRIDDDHAFKKLRDFAVDNYKNFSNFIRDSTIHKICDRVKKVLDTNISIHDPILSDDLRILAEYVLQHPGSKKAYKTRGKMLKEVSNLKRIEKILETFSDEQRTHFIGMVKKLEIDAKGKSEIVEIISKNAQRNDRFSLQSLIDPNFAINDYINRKSQPKKTATPLMIVVVQGDITQARKLLTRRPPAHPDLPESEHKVTPLIWTIMEGNLEMAKLLLDHGANPYLKDNEGRSLLDYAGFCERTTGNTNVVNFVKTILQQKSLLFSSKASDQTNLSDLRAKKKELSHPTPRTPRNPPKKLI